MLRSFLHPSRRRLTTGLRIAAAALLALASFGSGVSAAPDAPQPAAYRRGKLTTVPPSRPQFANTPQRAARNVHPIKNVAPELRGAHAADPVDLKVLVISADGTDGQPYELPSIERELQRIGIPFDVLIASQHTLNGAAYVPAGVTYDQALANVLSNGVAPSTGGHGYYQAVMLTTGNLWLPNFTSAFSDAEWAALAAYEASFLIRQVTDYTSTVGGPSNYCLSYTGETSTSPASPVIGSLTTPGQALFSYLQPTAPITIAYAYVYKAVADPNNQANGVTFTPLVAAPDGSILASTCKFADGRENLAMTFANNPDDGADVNFIDTLLLSYGVVNWATKGHFLGERHVNQNIEPDDLFIEDDVWNPSYYMLVSNPLQPGIDCIGNEQQCPTARMSGSDISFLLSWQASSSIASSSPGFRFDFPFNGEGTVSTNINSKFLPDTLTPSIQANQGQFNFISHTYSHLNLDQNCVAYTSTFPATCTQLQAPTHDQIITELQKNDQVAKNLKLAAYSKDSFVNPDISGLTSATAQQALFDFGIKYEVSDTSRPGQNNPSFNAGINNSLQPSILELPRHASNLFYNLYTPADWVQEYNCFYYQGGITVNGQAGVHCGDSSFDQYRYLTSPIDYAGIVDHESDALLSYLLKWDLDPLMFHQENLVQYTSGGTLLTDLLNAALHKYQAVYRLPIRNLRDHDTALKMEQRTVYNTTTGLSASMVPCGTAGAKAALTLVSPSAVTVPVTGASTGGSAEVYGGQNISYVSLAPNAPATVPLTCP